MKTDAQLKHEVLNELKWDPRIDETEVGVEVDNGVVTLTGIVESYAKRIAAQEAAHRVAGVLDVANDIQVKPPGSLERTDTELAHAVRQALECEALVPQERIQSTVSDGWVTLSGTVDSELQREHAKAAIRNVVGVKGISDRISIEPTPADIAEIRREIEAELERQAQRRAAQIDVAVRDNGAVTLSGPVTSYAEEEVIIKAVRCTPGVRTVESQLYLETGGQPPQPQE